MEDSTQPPFLTFMILAVYAHLPKTASTRAWLRLAMDMAIGEYHGVWMNAEHLTATGLSRYHDFGYGPPPEVEPGHFDAVYAVYARKFGMDIRSFEEAYTTRKISVPERDEYFVHDRAMRESCHS